MIVPSTLENLIEPSILVVEGKVRSQQSFWDAEKKNIYTVNEIDVFKIFKGVTTINTINVVTQGGTVDLQMDKVSNALELEVGDMGVFLLQNFLGDLSVPQEFYRPTETVLGFIRYDLVTGAAHGVYESYMDIVVELYGQITAATGISILEVGPWDSEDDSLSGEPSIEKSIISEDEGTGEVTFDVHAGVSDLLTITGADFGGEQGSISFADANSGGRTFVAALDNQIKEWTNDNIIVEVPYRAGTGKIRVDKSSGESLVSAEDVLIGYDHINVRYTDGSGTKSYETQLTSDNGNGGYDFQFQSDFADNIGASQAFISLIETWSCATGVNFQIGQVTAVDEDASDGINIVRFDNGDELGGNTLAYARSRYRGCYQDGTIKWYVDEIEVVVNDDFNWYYGDETPETSQFDFETVMLHEIGHTLQLGHVINSNEVMHFAVGPQQQKRQLSNIDAVGGTFVIDKSVSVQVCGRTPMEYDNVCCEFMEVERQPSDQVVCADKISATFNFDVKFSNTWQWQEKKGEVWVGLNDSDRYVGANTSKLTVKGPFEEGATFRCIAGNTCEENIVSSTARLSVHPMDFKVTTVQPDCEIEGQITIDRNQAQGRFNVSINGGVSYDYMWEEDDEQLNISAFSGSYSIWVQQGDGDCAVDLGTFVLEEPVALTLTAKVAEDADCNTGRGRVAVFFNDHPDYEFVLLSIDGGASYERFNDQMQSVIFEDLVEGQYQVLGKWEDNSCSSASEIVTIAAPTFPLLSVEEVQPNCTNSKGALFLNFEPKADASEIEISLDGGLSYEYTFDLRRENAVIEGLSEGVYELWARWNNKECSIDFGMYSIGNNLFKVGSCKAITVFLDEFGQATISGEDVYDATTEKGCSNVSLVLNQNTFSCDDVGDNEVKLTTIDENGDSSVCTAVITVKDVSNFCEAQNRGGKDVSLRVYPNPSSEMVSIQLSNQRDILHFRLFSASGIVVMESSPDQPENVYTANISHLQAGIYMVNITTEDGEIFKRISIE